MFMRTDTSSSMRSAEEITEPVQASKRVLVAIDRLDAQNSALSLGAALGRERDAQVCVVHVREHEHFGRASFDLETPEEASQLVDDAVAELRRQGVEASGRVVRALVGQAADAILVEASNVGAGEIIIGARRYGSIFGRRTRERLLRRSALPILVAPRPNAQPDRRAVTVDMGHRHAA
jgi:nucleotide-binding universal stress UspA family protein